jgi:hypothetical protein
MNKQKALSLLNEVRESELYNNIEYFIELYSNLEQRSLTYCNNANEAIQTVKELSDKSNIALDINDEFYESGDEKYE